MDTICFLCPNFPLTFLLSIYPPPPPSPSQSIFCLGFYESLISWPKPETRQAACCSRLLLTDTVVHATVSPPLKILSHIQMQCCSPCEQPNSKYQDFSKGVCHALKITVAERNPNMGILTKTSFASVQQFWMDSAKYEDRTEMTVWQ